MRTSAATLESELWDDELTHLLGLLRESGLRGKHLEIGTAAGGTLKEMMSAYEDGDRPSFVVVDPMGYFPDQMDIVARNLRSKGMDPDAVDFRVMGSDEAFMEAERNGERFDVIFVDGNHKIRYVTKDLRFGRLLNPGGLLLMHDYNRNHKGVMWAADRLLRKHPNYRRETLVSSLLVIRKQGPSQSPEVSAWDLWLANLKSPLLQWEKSIRKRLIRFRKG